MSSAATPSGRAAASDARISTMFVRALVEAVDAAGASAEAFAHVVRIDAALLASPYGWVDAVELDRLTSAAVAFTGDPAFGLHWAERSPMTKFDLMAMVTAHAPTLRAALSFVQQFQPVLSDVPELAIVERAHTVLLRIDPLAVTETGTRARTDLLLAGLARLLRFAKTPPSAIRRVLFAHRAPGYRDEYARIFPAHVSFEQPCSAIELERSCLDLDLPLANPELHQLLTVQAQNVVARAGHDAGHAGKVRDHLRRAFPRLPSMPEAARALNISVRSLRRRLDEEGWSYSALLQESRLELARQLLLDPTRSIKEIGFAAGFATSAAFHRAFKRWTGASPMELRSALLRAAPEARPAHARLD